MSRTVPEWTLTYYVYYCDGLMAETRIELIKLRKIIIG